MNNTEKRAGLWTDGFYYKTNFTIKNKLRFQINFFFPRKLGERGFITLFATEKRLKTFGGVEDKAVAEKGREEAGLKRRRARHCRRNIC